MKYYSEEDIITQGWANAAQLQRIGNRAISIVRCKDCRFNETEDCPFCYFEPEPFSGTTALLDSPNENFYCKYGEERDELLQ